MVATAEVGSVVAAAVSLAPAVRMTEEAATAAVGGAAAARAVAAAWAAVERWAVGGEVQRRALVYAAPVRGATPIDA